MQGMIIRWALNVVGLFVADKLLDGVSVDESFDFFLAALVLGFVNAVVRPIAILLTLPATILSMGLFLWVINGAMLALVGWLMPTVHVDGLWTAMVGSLIIGVVAWLGNMFIGPQGGVEVMVMTRRPPGEGPDRLDQ
jgi:putative membrane protein